MKSHLSNVCSVYLRGKNLLTLSTTSFDLSSLGENRQANGKTGAVGRRDEKGEVLTLNTTLSYECPSVHPSVNIL